MSIPIVPFEDRLAFWKFQNASCAFEQVRVTCKHMLTEQIEDGHPLHIPLQTAVHIHYGKPFKQRPAVRVPPDIVPAEYAEVHRSLIMMRDKIHAHTDSDGPVTTDDILLNKVLVVIRGTNVQYASTLLFPRLNRIDEIRQLAEILAGKAGYHAEKIWNKHMGREWVPTGDYSVNLSPGDAPFFEPLVWSG